MMTSRQAGPISWIILIVLILVLGGVAFWSFRRGGRRETKETTSSLPGLADRNLLVPPFPFGYKTAWFAVRSTDVDAVAAALQLERPQQANWQYGIWHSVESDDYAIFVCSPINGWILAVGVPILFEADSHATQRMVELSRQFGEAQLFVSMRVSDVYVWAWAKNGRLVRRFYEGDGERSETGVPTDAELELGIKFFDASSPEAKEPGYWKRKDLVFVDEQYVLRVAGKWSVDPSKLNEMGLTPSLGVLGTPSASYPPKSQPIRRKNN